MTFADNRSITRGFKILESLGDTQLGLTVADVSRSTGLHRATVHRLLTVLVDLGYVHKSPEDKKYTTAFYLHTLGRKEHVVDLLTKHCRPFLEELAANTNGVCHIGELEGRRVHITDVVAIGSKTASPAWVGMRVDAHASAIGKSLLSVFSDSEIHDRYGDSLFDTYTSRTISSVGELLKSLEQTRRQGYAICNQEFEPRTLSLGVALTNPHGRATCAISLTLDSHKYLKTGLQSASAALLRTKDRILDFVIDAKH